MLRRANHLAPGTHHALCVIHDALAQPRQRDGTLPPCTAESVALTSLLAACPLIPHGGLDTLDQAQMVLAVILGRPVQSASDERLARALALDEEARR